MYANPKDPSLTGHFFIAMDISKIISKEQMKERMAQFKDRLKATPMWQEGAEMLLPGELEYRKEVERRRDGLPIPVTTYEELAQLAEEYDIKAPLTIKMCIRDRYRAWKEKYPSGNEGINRNFKRNDKERKEL